MENDVTPRDPAEPQATAVQSEMLVDTPTGLPLESAPDTPTADPFIGPRDRPRRGFESSLVRIVATCGIIGIAVALAAILGTQNISAWVIGLAVSTLSVVLAAILWSSRML